MVLPRMPANAARAGGRILGIQSMSGGIFIYRRSGRRRASY